MDAALLNRLAEEGDQVLAGVFDEHHDRLWQMVTFRMHRLIAGRVDAEDVLQEAYLGARKRLPHYLANPKHSLFVWIRMIVMQTLVDVHRRHVGSEKRAADREVGLGGNGMQSTAVTLAGHLAASQTSPSGKVARREATDQLEQAIATMPEMDQEIIALRHFEELSNQESAEILGLSPTAASNRYVRALTRLREILDRWESSTNPAGGT